MIQIPSGSCDWSSGIIVPAGIGITIKGSGTPNSTAATFGAEASCTATRITLNGATGFKIAPTHVVALESVFARGRIADDRKRMPGLDLYRRVREMRVEEELSPDRSHVMLLDPAWVAWVGIGDRPIWAGPV